MYIHIHIHTHTHTHLLLQEGSEIPLVQELQDNTVCRAVRFVDVSIHLDNIWVKESSHYLNLLQKVILVHLTSRGLDIGKSSDSL